MELHEGQNSETLGNDEAREGDATDDMTDMMTKKGKGSNDTLNREEGDAVGQSQAFQLDGVNKNVEIKWQIPEIEPQYVLEYQESKQDVQYEITKGFN